VGASVFYGVDVTDLFSFLCCVFCFVCLRPVFYGLNVASLYELPLRFSLKFIYNIMQCLFFFHWR